jgi:ankyrin repeat protein
MTALIWAAHQGQTSCARALIEAKADLNAKAVSCSRLFTRSATLKSVQLIQTTQIRSKTPSYVVAFACELVALLCLHIIELYVYLLVRIVGWMAAW